MNKILDLFSKEATIGTVLVLLAIIGFYLLVSYRTFHLARRKGYRVKPLAFVPVVNLIVFVILVGKKTRDDYWEDIDSWDEDWDDDESWDDSLEDEPESTSTDDFLEEVLKDESTSAEVVEEVKK